MQFTVISVAFVAAAITSAAPIPAKGSISLPFGLGGSFNNKGGEVHSPVGGGDLGFKGGDVDTPIGGAHISFGKKRAEGSISLPFGLGGSFNNKGGEVHSPIGGGDLGFGGGDLETPIGGAHISFDKKRADGSISLPFGLGGSFNNKGGEVHSPIGGGDLGFKGGDVETPVGGAHIHF